MQIVKRVALASVAGGALVSCPAWAQEALPASSQTVATGDPQDIVVVGTRGQPRSSTQSAAPVDVIGGDQLDTLGNALPMRDLLVNLIPSFQSPGQQSASWDSVSRPAGLRGLGGGHVLVLVDGKRRHNSSMISLAPGSISIGANPVDLDLIPENAIQRIEVLRDGASAQYGSDAIAGVINLVLKNHDQGGRLTVGAGQRYEGDGETYTADLFQGFALGDRGFLAIDIAGKSQKTAIRNQPATGAFYFPVNGMPDPRETGVNRFVYRGGLPQNRSIRTLANAGYDLGTVKLYANATFAAREARVGQAYRRPNSNTNLLQVYPNGYTPSYTLDERDWQSLVGAKGALSGWSWDLSTSYGVNAADNGSINSLNASLGPGSPTRFKTFHSFYSLWVSNLDINREFEIGLASPLNVAFGAEYRREFYRTTPLDAASYANGGYSYPAGYGGLVGQFAAVGAQGAVLVTPANAARVSRSNVAAYLDLAADVLPGWQIDLAGRYEHYSDSSGNVISGKASTRVELADWVAVRGTVSNGFRAPSLTQIGFANSSYSVITGANGIPVLTNTQIAAVGSPLAVAIGAQPLKPERSTNFSAGIVVTPARSLSLTVDAYRIELRNRVVLTGVLSGAGLNAVLAANGFTPQVVRYFNNGVDTDTNGVDVVATYALRTGSDSNLRLSAAYNYTKTTITSLAPTPSQLAGLNLTLFDRSSQGSLTSDLPYSKVILGADWQVSRLGVSLHATRFAGFDWIQNNPAQDTRNGARILTDIDVRYSVTKQLTFAVGAQNIFDVYPSKTFVNTLGIPAFALYSPFGSYGGYYYARAEVKW